MKKLIALIALSCGFANAGEMQTDIDNFTGEADTYFIGSVDNVGYVVSRLKSGRAILSVRPRDGLTHCNRYPLLIKTADSKIHKLKADETQSKACHVIVSPAMISGEFVVRIPMYNTSDIDVTIDTANMDWAAMGTRKGAK
jgi:hypothetical protein